MNLKELLESEQEISLVVQGGGMRGIYSVSALAQLDKMGYRDRFKNIFATSSGAINGAYFLSGQAEEGISAYADYLSNKQFINYKRINKIVDVDFLIDDVLSKKVILNQDKLKASQSILNIGLACAESGNLIFKNQHSSFKLNEIFRAAAALPILYGKEIVIGGRRYVDGGLISTAPFRSAQKSGAKNILVILTRDPNYKVSYPGKIEAAILKNLAKIRGHSKKVIDHLLEKDHDIDFLLKRNLEGNIYIIQPRFNQVSRTTSNKEVLLQASKSAKQDVLRHIIK